MYYDLSDGEFVYLENGRWMFSTALPPMYSWYELNGGFVIALDVNVYQPWLHHQFYLSHYPRYYYRNFYPRRDIVNIRGFNENDDRPVYWTDGERSRMTEIRRNPPHPVNPAVRRQPQETNYYGKEIGRSKDDCLIFSATVTDKLENDWIGSVLNGKPIEPPFGFIPSIPEDEILSIYAKIEAEIS